MALASFLDVLIAWPSFAELARDLSVPTATVRSWRVRGVIPARHWDAIAAAAQRRAIRGVTYDRLRTIARERKQAPSPPESG